MLPRLQYNDFPASNPLLRQPFIVPRDNPKLLPKPASKSLEQSPVARKPRRKFYFVKNQSPQNASLSLEPTIQSKEFHVKSTERVKRDYLVFPSIDSKSHKESQEL